MDKLVMQMFSIGSKTENQEANRSSAMSRAPTSWHSLLNKSLSSHPPLPQPPKLLSHLPPHLLKNLHHKIQLTKHCHWDLRMSWMHQVLLLLLWTNPSSTLTVTSCQCPFSSQCNSSSHHLHPLWDQPLLVWVVKGFVSLMRQMFPMRLTTAPSKTPLVFSWVICC